MNPTDGPTTSEPWDKLYDVMAREVAFEQKIRQALSLGVQYLDADRDVLVRTDAESDT